MRRNYNRNRYKHFARANKAVRERVSPDPFESTGRIVGAVLNKLIVKPLHSLTYIIVSVLYNKKKDIPYKGSIIYTIVKVGLLALLGIVVTTLVGISGGTTL